PPSTGSRSSRLATGRLPPVDCWCLRRQKRAGLLLRAATEPVPSALIPVPDRFRRGRDVRLGRNRCSASGPPVQILFKDERSGTGEKRKTSRPIGLLPTFRAEFQAPSGFLTIGTCLALEHTDFDLKVDRRAQTPRATGLLPQV